MKHTDWIKKVETELIEAKKIPLWGNLPPFPWEKCAEQLTKSLQLPEVTLRAQETSWREANSLLQGLGAHPVCLSLELSPLKGTFYWALAQEDLASLTACALTTEATHNFSTPAFQEGFYRFLALEALQTLNTLQMYDTLSLKLASDQPLPSEDALCTDVALTLKEQTLWGRLICPSSSLHHLRTHFENKPISLETSELKHQIDVELHCELGTTTLALSALKKVSLGDLILLDSGSYEPQKRRGLLTLTLGNTPLFLAQLHEEEIKILDYTYYHEESSMPDKPIDENDFEDEFEDEEFENEEPENKEAEKEEIEESEQEEEEHLWEPPSESKTLEEIITSASIPVTLTVEVGRLQMNLNKLLELKPGNVLELATSINKPVDVCMNGKKIAKAELVKLGELLGIKILHIGDI